MDLEQMVKDLQAQNSQFQQLLLTLAKGQEELKTLLEKEKEKKKKKPNCMVIMARRFQGNAKRTLDFPTTSDEGERKGKETAVPSDSEEEEEEEDYFKQQYPSADDKYKHLEEWLSAIEIQRVPGLDFEELGLVSGIVIPPKFKVPFICQVWWGVLP